MKNYKILLYAIIGISIVLCIPSVIYLITVHTVDGFEGYYTYFLTKSESLRLSTISGCIVIGLLLLYSVLYLKIIKNEKEIFKDKKEIIRLIVIISFIFMMILPFLSSDIFYYIGDSWLTAKYHENPYYTTVQNLQEKGISDEILNNTGYWKNTVSVYGPLYNMIAIVLSSFSFGNVTVALFIFKIASMLVHIFNCYLIYKLTKSTKYMLLYGLNPLVLIELLTNVHNEIYIVCFVLLALYFMIRKKNKYLTILALALSVAVKYSTIILVPFILIYLFREKSVIKRIIWCILGGLSVIGVVILFYLPFYQDISIFTNMLVQNSKYSQSIMLGLMMSLDGNSIFQIIDKLKLPLFAVLYVITVAYMVFKKNIKLKELMRFYNILMLIFIFIVLTNFQKWYILWLLPTIPWQKKDMKNFILALTITAIIPSRHYFTIQNDAVVAGMWYSIEMFILSIIIVFLIKGGRYIKKKMKIQELS